MQNSFEALLEKYRLENLIHANQVNINYEPQADEYSTIQAIFNDQIDQATNHRDWQRVIELLKAMVGVSQNAGNLDDTIISELSLLYLTYSRYYNTDLQNAQVQPIIEHLNQLIQQAQATPENVNALIQNVVNNLTVPNNLPLSIDPRNELTMMLQQSRGNAAASTNNPTLDQTINSLQQESMRSRRDQIQNVDLDHDEDSDDMDDYEDEAPFYKKWWFWTLIVLILLIVGVVIRLIVSKVTTPTSATPARTEQVAKSSQQQSRSEGKKKIPVHIPD
ncbi:hypothetical protein ACNAN0_02855 [Agrilactobacillus fermenti]|uniref:hypothetical protein n=1 Tax=Agrilactobacillus fermenti TaxID=2586909 RepID=UPI001E5E9C8B|nr:hypothetical protein [Agrilactobacillus fermenti]MCD2256342.1 hypothetical protein [Agrilactobacillus fermenti]